MTHEEIVWEARMDGRYDVRVVREADYQGKLIIKDMDGSVLDERTVRLSYGARFGPDVGDVDEWQRTAAGVVDSQQG